MILMYHKVGLFAPTMWWVDVENFYRQMCLLRARKVVSLRDYDPGNEDHVVITFDGVYKNILDYAAPIMQMFGYPFELFLSSDWIGLKNVFDPVEPTTEFAGKDDLLKLVSLGGRLQWHTRSHPLMDLTKGDRSWTDVERELCIPADVRDLDPEGFSWFAYPYGKYSPDVLNEVRRRFIGAVSCDKGDDRDTHQLTRVTVTNNSFPLDRSLSVIVVSYNYGEYLVDAIESVLHQTFAVRSILVMDDASEDSTQEIGKRYESLYPDIIRYVRNDIRQGIVGTFNRAVSEVDSEFICFLGADNRLSSNYIEICLTTALSSGSDITYTDFRLFGKNASTEYFKHPADRRGRIIDDTYYEINFPEFRKERMLQGNFIHGSALYSRRAFDAVGGYKDRKPGKPEDAGLFRRMISSGFHAQKAAGAWLEYRQHSDDQANIVSRMQGDLEFYRIYAKRLELKVKALEATFGVLSPVVKLAGIAEKGFFEALMKLARYWRRITR